MPEIPADLSTLTDEELAELLDQVQAFFEENRETAELAELQSAAEGAETIRTEQAARVEAAEARDREVAELASRVTPPTDETEEEPEGETPPAPEAEGETPPGGEAETPPETPAENEPEQIAAAAPAPAPRREPARPRAPRSMQPRETSRTGPTITAAADIPNVPAGRELSSLAEVADLMITRQSHLGRGRADGDDRVLVASVRSPRPPDERFLSGLSSDEANGVKIGQAISPEAITAAGGLCAPTEGYYDQLVIAEDLRPVRDALTGFGADRGGIRFTPPPSLSDVTSGVQRTTAAQDLAGTPTKPCVTITCPATTEVVIAAISECLQVGNFRGRTYNEQVQAWLRLLGAQHARVAETALLDGIATCSTAVTAAQQYGTARQVIAQMARAAAGFRSRNRMRPDARLHWMGPAWLIDAMVADLVNDASVDPASYERARATVVNAFDNVGVNVTFYVDTKTGGGQVFGAQAVGALLSFPTTAVMYLYAEGSFIFLDGGELDLGLVRDSTLNANNNFQMFAETFENVACVGPQSLEVTATICSNGTYGPAGTALSCPV